MTLFKIVLYLCLFCLCFSRPICCERCGTISVLEIDPNEASTLSDEEILDNFNGVTEKKCIFGRVCYAHCGCQKKQYFDFFKFIKGEDLKTNFPILSQNDYSKVQNAVYDDMWKVIQQRDYENDPNSFGGKVRTITKRFCDEFTNKYPNYAVAFCGGTVFTKKNWGGYTKTLAQYFNMIVEECLKKETPKSEFAQELEKRSSTSHLAHIYDLVINTIQISKVVELDVRKRVDVYKKSLINNAINSYFDGNFHPSCLDFQTHLKLGQSLSRENLTPFQRDIYEKYWKGFFDNIKNVCKNEVCKK